MNVNVGNEVDGDINNGTQIKIESKDGLLSHLKIILISICVIGVAFLLHKSGALGTVVNEGIKLMISQ